MGGRGAYRGGVPVERRRGESEPPLNGHTMHSTDSSDLGGLKRDVEGLKELKAVSCLNRGTFSGVIAALKCLLVEPNSFRSPKSIHLQVMMDSYGHAEHMIRCNAFLGHQELESLGVGSLVNLALA